MAARNEASITAVIGASGTGKSFYVKETLLRRPPARLFVWDFKREYDQVAHPVSLTEAARAARAPRFHIVFQPDMDAQRRAEEFALFCRLAYAAGAATLLVEELAFITRPSYAPPAWRMMTCTGRHEGMQVIGTSQRPAQIDKDFLGSATRIHVSRLNDENDVRVMAAILGVDKARIRNLVADPAAGCLEWIERDMKTGRVSEGAILLTRERPPPRRRSGSPRTAAARPPPPPSR